MVIKPKSGKSTFIEISDIKDFENENLFNPIIDYLNKVRV